MFIDYKSLVVHDYREKRDAGTLSLRLIRPTPGQLKDECMAVCNGRYTRKDERTLKAFFGQGGDKAACLKAIEHYDINKFRPLVNFLRRSTDATEYKNIELLAWLIDFKDRPFDYSKRYDIRKAQAEEGPGQGGESKKPAQSISGKPVSTFRAKRVFMAIIILAPISLGIYSMWPPKPAAVALTGPQGCMYWAEDHYQQVPCNQKMVGSLVIALDSEKLNHLHKITRQDTITTRSKGHVWYVKVNGTIEYYTADGFYPLDLRLRLKPITDYIIGKYIRSNQQGLQVSK